MNDNKHNYLKKPITYIIILLFLLFLPKTLDASSTTQTVYTGKYYGLDYKVNFKTKEIANKRFNELTDGDLEMVISGQIDPIVLEAFNKTYSEKDQNIIHQNKYNRYIHFKNNYPTFPDICSNLIFFNQQSELLKFVDTIKFEGQQDIILPKNISSFFYKTPYVTKLEGLNKLDISNTEIFENLFDGSEAETLDISEWDLKDKSIYSLGQVWSKNFKIIMGSNTILKDTQPIRTDGKMVNQETGFIYNAETFFKDYDGTHPGTYKFVP